MTRLDALQIALWDKAVGGDAVAVGYVLKILERRSRLAGLDAPIRIKANVEPMALQIEFENAAAEFDRKLQMKVAAMQVN